MKEEQSILCVGLMCLDIVSVLDHFPREDSDTGVLEQVWQRGGNASNSSSVMALLGANVHLLATVARSHENCFLADDLESFGVTGHLVYHENQRSPTTVCIVNQQTGSRTLMFCPHDLPELTYDDFDKIDLSQFKWIHFESRRNESQMVQMLSKVDKYNATCPSDKVITTSVELEKTRKDLDVLYDKADYVFVSKEHAEYQGYTNMCDAVNGLIHRCRKGASLICAWGDKGAAALTSGESTPLVLPVYPPDRLVDTLAAGDTFNAATIVCLSRGWALRDAVDMGCKVAGAKCGMRGLKGLKGMFVLSERGGKKA